MVSPWEIRGSQLKVTLLEQLQQFGKSTWHLSNFAKTRKIGLQQFDKPTWQKWKLAKTSSRAYMRCARGSWLPSLFPSRWEGEKRIK
jgi:hypothetical protein